MSFKNWEKPLGFLPPGQYELDPAEPINQAGPPAAAWYAANLPGGPQLVDLSANGNHGALQGGTAWVAGRDGPALDFPGNNGNAVDPPDLNPTGALTLFAAITPDVLGQQTRSISKWAGSPLQYLLQLGAGSDNVVFGIAGTVLAGATSLATPRYVTIAGVYQPSVSMHVYLDGAQDGEKTSSVPSSNPATSNNLLLGALSLSSSISYDGAYHVSLIFPRALPAASIRRLHHRPYALLRPVRRWWAVALEAGITHPVIGSDVVGSPIIRSLS